MSLCYARAKVHALLINLEIVHCPTDFPRLFFVHRNHNKVELIRITNIFLYVCKYTQNETVFKGHAMVDDMARL